MSARTDAAPAGHPDPAQGYYSNRRRDIELVLPPHAGSVLEVGCGAGETLRWLKATGRCTSTTGIEIVSAAGELARAHVDRVLVGDAERLIDTELAARSFDLVLCLDVLEHLVDPWAFARKAANLVVPGGLLIASVPNVRNVRVVTDLLFRGRWAYQSAGILDRTHLRFFTRESAVSLLSAASLRIERVVPNVAGRSAIIDRLTAGLFSDLLAIQFIIAARATAS